MRRAFTVTLLLSLVVMGLFGQDTKTGRGMVLTFTPPDPSSPVPGEMLRKIAVQIELQCKVNGRPKSFAGTGFLVGIAAPSSRTFQYLVTNRHVAQCWDETNRPQEVVATDLRINTEGGGAVRVPLNSTDGKTVWVFPSNDSVDLAVMPIRLPDNLKFDTLLVGFSSFAARDSFRQHRIGEGSTVIVTGYFVQFPGEHKFQPILRQGTLAMLSDEPMMTTTGKAGTVYLADVHIFGGNSGSPVFAIPQDDITLMGQHWLIGIVSGYYYEKADSKMEIAVTVKGETEANSGIALIVPADEIKNLIENNPILKGYRDAYLSTLKNQTPSAPH